MITFHCSLPYDLNDPLEQGGLMFGTRDGETATVHACTGPLPGDDRGTHHLTLCSPQHGHAAGAAAGHGWVYLGYWHSHPAGTPPTPSDVDVTDFHEAARVLFPTAPYLDFPIITGGILHAWRLAHDLTLKEVNTRELRPRQPQAR